MGTGIRSRSPPMSKFCSDLCVCAPHSLPETEHGNRNRQINRSSSIQAAAATRADQNNPRRTRSAEQSRSGREEGGGRNHALVVGDLDGAEGVALLAEAGGDRAGQRRP